MPRKSRNEPVPSGVLPNGPCLSRSSSLWAAAAETGAESGSDVSTRPGPGRADSRRLTVDAGDNVPPSRGSVVDISLQR